MKEYIKSQIKNIPMTLVMFILFYGITTLATNYLFNSNEVSYDNTISGIKQDNVQGAIDELYACTSNYAAYNTRLTNAETKIGTGNLTTTSNTLIGGVNELKTNIGNVPSGKTTQGQINDLNNDLIKIGTRVFNGTLAENSTLDSTWSNYSFYIAHIYDAYDGPAIGIKINKTIRFFGATCATSGGNMTPKYWRVEISNNKVTSITELPTSSSYITEIYGIK